MTAVVIVLFEPDPELEAMHRRTEYAPGRPSCTCGWIPVPTPLGQKDENRRLLEHRRLESRRRVLIEGDYYLAWMDQFGTGQMIADGPTGDRHLADLKAHASGE